MYLCYVHEGEGREHNLARCKAYCSLGQSLVSTPSQMVKINVDVSWKVGASKSYVGVVVRDLRKICLKIRRKEVHASSAAVAEALAVLEGCQLAQQSNYFQIMVESDCKQIISYLNGGAENCS